MKIRHVLGVVASLALAVSTPAPAAGLDALHKAYFDQTKPGSWAKYEQTVTDSKGKVQKSIVTLSRLEGEGGRVWFEMRSEPKEGARSKPTTVRYLLNPDFKVEKDALNYLKYIDRLIMQEDGKDALEYPAEMLQTVAGTFTSSVDYGADVTPLGSGTENGRSCDRYRILGRFDVKVLFVRMKGTTDSEICMSDSVPFGRVAEKTVAKDDNGKLMSTTESRLVDSGTGATSHIRGPVKKMETPPGMPWGR